MPVDANSEKVLCIHGEHDVDGSLAAWVVGRAHGEANVKFQHESFNGLPCGDMGYAKVVICGIDWGGDVIRDFFANADPVLVLTRGRPQPRDPGNIPQNMTRVAEPIRSHAMVAWKYFFPDEEPPRLLRYMEDWSLRRYRLPFSEHMQQVLSVEQVGDYSYWDRCMGIDLSIMEGIGSLARRQKERNLRELIRNRAFEADIAGFRVPVLNCAHDDADAALKMMAKRKPFGLTYYVGPGGCHVRLFSYADGEDVSEIAELLNHGPLTTTNTARRAEFFVNCTVPDFIQAVISSDEGVVD